MGVHNIESRTMQCRNEQQTASFENPRKAISQQDKDKTRQLLDRTHHLVLLDLDDQSLQLVHQQLVAGLAVGQVLAEPSLQRLAHRHLLRLQKRLQHHLQQQIKRAEGREQTTEIKHYLHKIRPALSQK